MFAQEPQNPKLSRTLCRAVHLHIRTILKADQFVLRLVVCMATTRSDGEVIREIGRERGERSIWNENNYVIQMRRGHDENNKIKYQILSEMN